MGPYHRIYRVALVLLLAAFAHAITDQDNHVLLASDNIAIYTETIRLDPNNVSAYQQRGAVYYWKGEYDKAIEDFTQVIRLDPSNRLTYIGRSFAYSRKGDMRKANADFNKANSLDPDFYARYSPQ